MAEYTTKYADIYCFGFPNFYYSQGNFTKYFSTKRTSELHSLQQSIGKFNVQFSDDESSRITPGFPEPDSLRFGSGRNSCGETAKTSKQEKETEWKGTFNLLSDVQWRSE